VHSVRRKFLRMIFLTNFHAFASSTHHAKRKNNCSPSARQICTNHRRSSAKSPRNHDAIVGAPPPIHEQIALHRADQPPATTTTWWSRSTSCNTLSYRKRRCKPHRRSCWYRAAECLSVQTKPRGGLIGFLIKLTL